MGALAYEPSIEDGHSLLRLDFDEIAQEVLYVQGHDDDRFIDDLLRLNGSSAGARPKVLVEIAGEKWLIKFSSAQDPKDIGPIEYAYHLMAQAAGLNLSPAKLFPSNSSSA